MAQPERKTIINPKWIKPSMTIHQAATQANLRGFTLRASWHQLQGLRIVAEPIIAS